MAESSPIDSHELGAVPRRARPRRRPVRFLVMLIAIVLVGNALVGERGLLALVKIRADAARLSQLIVALRTENDALREYVRALGQEPRMIEEVARGELGLIQPGEIVFIVSDVTEPADGRWPASGQPFDEQTTDTSSPR